jgi:drug/metabolite transporter (DMT)-like permease
MNLFNAWQINLIAHLISLVVFFQCYKLAVRNVKRDGAATILLQTLASIAVLFLVPFFPFILPSDPKFYLLLLAACIFYAINDRLQTTARKNLQVSVYSIVNQLSNVFLIIIGLTIFREGLVLQKLVGAGLILFGNIFLFYKKGTFKPNKYVWVAVVASLFCAIAISTDIGISKQFNLPFYIMITLALPALIILFGERIKLSEVLREYSGQDRKWYVITGIAWAFTIFFSLRAFQLGSVTTIVPLAATAVLLNVIVAYLFLGEKKDEWRKIIAALLVIAGIYLTVF